MLNGSGDLFMSISLRVVLLLSALILLCVVIRKLKKFQMDVMDCTFWIIFSASFVLMAVVPEIPSWISALLGFQAPVNFVFLYVIAVLLVRDFTSALTISKLKLKIDELVQELALRDHCS